MKSSLHPSEDLSSSDEESFELIDDLSLSNEEKEEKDSLTTANVDSELDAVNEAQTNCDRRIEEERRVQIKEKEELEGRMAALVKKLDMEKEKCRMWKEHVQHENKETGKTIAELMSEIGRHMNTIDALTAENEKKTKEIERLKKTIEEMKVNGKRKEDNQNKEMKNKLIELDGKMEELSIGKLFKKKTSQKINLDLQHNTEGIEIAAEVKESIIPLISVANSVASIRTVKIVRGKDGQIGMQTYMSSIYNVFVDSPAHLSGVRRGDEIVSIDGVTVNTYTSEKKLYQLLDNGSASITLQLQHNPELLEEHILRSEEVKNLEERSTRTVTLSRGANGAFGLSRIGSSIYTVYNDTSAHQNGVKRGDQIISINGVEVETLTRDEMFMLFKSAAESVTLVIQHNPERIQNRTAAREKLWEMGIELERIPTRSVTLCSEEGGLFGLSHIGTSISIVNENSPSSNGGVMRGDQIVCINGKNVEMESEDEISGMFEKARKIGKISLVLRHNLERLIDLERAWNHRK